MPLGTKVGLDPSDIVLDGHPAPPPPKKKGGGRALPIFGPCLLWPKRLHGSRCHLDGSWSWLRPHCATWDRAPLPKKGGTAPNFRHMFLVTKWLDG